VNQAQDACATLKSETESHSQSNLSISAGAAPPGPKKNSPEVPVDFRKYGEAMLPTSPAVVAVQSIVCTDRKRQLVWMDS
jgi:hypothetical protein